MIFSLIFSLRLFVYACVLAPMNAWTDVYESVGCVSGLHLFMYHVCMHAWFCNSMHHVFLTCNHVHKNHCEHVGMYDCINVCMYVFKYVTLLSWFLPLWACVCMYVCMYMHVCAPLCAKTSSVYACIYACMCVCMRLCTLYMHM